MQVRVFPVRVLRGTISVPGDKSISHRAALLGAIAEGATEVKGFALGKDPRTTLEVLRRLGVRIERKGDILRIHGVGLRGLKPPDGPLYAGNSGTLIKLISGILAGQEFHSVLTGDDSLKMRPMRVVEPLRLMGAEVSARDDLYPPLAIRGRFPLKPVHYALPVASATVKSAVLLAGLCAEGRTTVEEPAPSRDHTERMLGAFGARIERRWLREGRAEDFERELERRLRRAEGEGRPLRVQVSVEGVARLEKQRVAVPGDISSAAFFLVAGAIVPKSHLRIRGVGLNPTRKAVVDVLRRMGADIRVEEERLVCGEPVGDLVVRGSELKGTRIAGALIPNLIDELPVLAVAAACARGETVIRDASELRTKETDRIRAVVENLRRMGAKVGELPDGMVIGGRRPLRGALVDSFGDHRIAMAFAVAGLAAEGETAIEGAEWADISFPGFFELLERISRR
ncbi:MAG TPA: 3-phosphoshikimate 1-carboxyvinyltransferase [Candidatus Latescibacteria bacterium]|nr:3-phosphoshikimate 1-carboxyvinyltransferase [Candidatus Latescibacterota bacterium]